MSDFGLRDYQKELVNEIYQAWADGFKNVLAVLPTGGGKTRCMASICLDFTVRNIIIPKVKEDKLVTSIQVHRKELVQQICLTLADAGIPHNIIAPKNVILGIVGAERRVYGKSLYNPRATVTVTSVDTLNSRIGKHREWAKSVRFWITDEAAHVLKKNKWGEAVSYFPNAIGLGVTATPQRLDKRGLGSHADGVFDVMVQGPNVRWLIEQGYLSKYKCAIPESDYKAYLKEANDGHDYTKQAMAEASLKSHVVGDVVTNYIRHANGKQAIVFASDIAAGARMEAEFKANNISAKLLTGETPDGERLNTILKYSEGKIKVLINVDLFDEGLDVPGIEVVIMARPTKSLGKFLQQIGRGLRPHKSKPYAIIIDHVGNIAEHGLPCQPRKWTLDRIVKRRDKVNLIRICKNFMCNAPFDRLLHACPYCNHEDTPAAKGSRDQKETLKQVDGDLMLMDPEDIEKMYGAAQLESPESVANRVFKAAGPAAAKAAAKNQKERMKTQQELANALALWAGKMKHKGYTDRMINKYFYQHYDMTITQALSEPKANMLETMERIKDDTW